MDRHAPLTLPGNDLLTRSDIVPDQDLMKTLSLNVRTAARHARAAYLAEKALSKCRLHDVTLEDGRVVRRSLHHLNDSIGIQLLKYLADDIEALKEAELGEGETELMRADRLAKLRAQEIKLYGEMRSQQAKTMDRGSREMEAATRLQFEMRKHQDKMKASNPDWDAQAVEAAADG
jgi:hypothetical protein